MKRRFFLGSIIAALAAAPFVSRYFRRTHQIPASGIVNVPVSPGVSSTGSVAFVQDELHFEPISLQDDFIHGNSLVAGVSSDKKSILFSYSYGSEWKSKLFHASLANDNSLVDISELICNDPQTMITSLACSAELGGGEQHISFVLRKNDSSINNREGFCDESLYRASLGRVDGKPSVATDGVVELMKRPNGILVPRKDFVIMDGGESRHCWLNGTNQMIFGGIFNIFRFDSNSVASPEPSIFSSHLIRSLGMSDGISEVDPKKCAGSLHKYLCSNFFDDQSSDVRFIEAPFSVTQPTKSAFDPKRDPFVTGKGTIVTMNASGKVINEHEFPSLPLPENAILSRTHWCFADLVANQFIITAPLEQPQNFTVLKFSDDEVEIPGKKINRNFRLFAILPGGRHLLCSRKVVYANIAEARKLNMPLCELGIVKLPFALG